MKSLSTASLIVLYLDHVVSLYDRETGVKTIGDFVKQVEVLSKENFPDVPEDSEDHPAYKFKGDMLEILGDIFFIIYSSDPAVGLIDYHSVPIDEDYGVDGIGINVNGDQVAYK